MIASLLPALLTREDHARLRLLTAAPQHAGPRSPSALLREKLARATIVDTAEPPAGIVTLDSEVEWEDLASGEIETYRLTLPDRADVELKRLSILAPISTALLGHREGEVVEWTAPGGTRRLRVLRVTRP